MNNLGQVVSFLPRLTITVQQCGFWDSGGSVRAAFCTSFKIIIREHVGKGGIQSLLLTRYVYLCEQKLTVVSKEGGSSPFPCCPENCNCLWRKIKIEKNPLNSAFFIWGTKIIRWTIYFCYHFQREFTISFSMHLVIHGKRSGIFIFKIQQLSCSSFVFFVVIFSVESFVAFHIIFL